MQQYRATRDPSISQVDREANIQMDAMRHAGYADALVARLSDPRADAALGCATPADIVLRRGMQDVLHFANRPDHRGYFAFIDSGTTFPAALAECIAAAASPYCGAWMALLTREPAPTRRVDAGAAKRLNRRR